MTIPVKAVDESQALVKILNEAMPDLKRMAPKYVNLSRLMALALEARMRNPQLAKCNITSVVAFCKRCAEWGTDRVGAGGVWAVPFWNKGTSSYDMIPIPDWRLLIEKAKKAKAILHATAEIVIEGDVFFYSRGMSPDLQHHPALGGTGDVIAAYCVYTLPDGTRDFVVMAAAEIGKVRNSSKAKSEGPWVDWPEEMAKKTVVKRTMKLFEGASIELTALLEADNAVLGLDLSPPEPIAMPRAIEAAPEEVRADTEQEATKQDGGQTIEGVIQDVVIKAGETKGKPWTKYGIIIKGVTYGTFDTKLGEGAKGHIGGVAKIAYKQDGKYLTCIGVDIITGHAEEREVGSEG